jgi:subtilase family serine protease
LRVAVASIRMVFARLTAAALTLPILLGGGAAPAVATHAMTPSAGGLGQYQDLGSAQDFATAAMVCHAPLCYGPRQLRAAYDVQPLLDAGIDGSGTSIVIVDAFQSPTIQSDLALFDATWGLPAAKLDVVAPDGLTPFDPTSRLQFGWAVEISLDVEWAHVVAPGAHIELVLAKSEKDADLLSATRYAIEHNLGQVITQSFGEAESCADPKLLRQEHAVFQRATAKGITLLAGSGDFGATNLLCDGSGIASVASVATPASDPNVTAVGGTRLVIDPVSSAYMGETAWNDAFGSSGGGFSSVYKRPGYQAPFVHGHARGVPDVAYSSSAFGATFFVALGHFGAIFGTSGGTPQWAGIVALARQAAGHRQSQLNIRLYHLARSHSSPSGFHDITTGDNTFHGVAGTSAGPGWDAVTGLGTPDVAKLVRLLSSRSLEGSLDRLDDLRVVGDDL